jgi:hypothetical protein
VRQTAFRLSPQHLDRLDAIAAVLSRRLGVEITRSDAVRILIDRFSLPKVSTDSQFDHQKTTDHAA